MSEQLDGRGGRQRGEMWLGWAALVCFVAAVAMALLKLEPFGFALLGIGAVLSIAALTMELRQRRSTKRAMERGEAQVFPETGTFGARRSAQTHTRMM